MAVADVAWIFSAKRGTLIVQCKFLEFTKESEVFGPPCVGSLSASFPICLLESVITQPLVVKGTLHENI